MIEWFGFIGTPLGWVMYFINNIVGNYGITLIIFSIIVKALMIPLGIKQQKSMVANARIQPMMKEIQKKYGNNREKQSEEMQKLYAKEKFSPFSSCLPMLIQMPILFGMLNVIYYPLKHMLRFSTETILQAIEIAKTVLGQANMSAYSLEMSVLTAFKQDPTAFSTGLDATAFSQLSNFDFTLFGLPLGEQPTMLPEGKNIGLYLILLLIPILSGISSAIMSKITMSSTGADPNAPGAGMNKTMMMMMPLMSVMISFAVPAGVGIYWLISNVLSSLQSFVLLKKYNPAEEVARAKVEAEEREIQERQERIELKKQAKERSKSGEIDEKALSQKELNRKKLAAARKRDAELYGDVYVEVTDEDIR